MHVSSILVVVLDKFASPLEVIDHSPSRRRSLPTDVAAIVANSVVRSDAGGAPKSEGRGWSGPLPIGGPDRAAWELNEMVQPARSSRRPR